MSFKVFALPASVLALTPLAHAQNTLEPATVRIESVMDRTKAINVEQSTTSAVSPAGAGFLSAKWILEPIQSSEYFRMQSGWRSGLYLNIERGYPEVSKAGTGWYSAQWTLKEQSARSFSDKTWLIYNRWKQVCLGATATASGRMDLVPAAQAAAAGDATAA